MTIQSSEAGASRTGRGRRALTALVATSLIGAGMLPLAATPAAADGAIWYRTGPSYGRHYAPPPRHYYRDRHWRGPVVHHHHRGYNNGDLAVAGIAGLAAGALIGGALAAPPAPPVVYAPPPVVYAPQPGYVSAGVPSAGGYPAFSAGWYSYCEAKYRSFDARSGTYMGYDGYRHYCQ